MMDIETDEDAEVYTAEEEDRLAVQIYLAALVCNNVVPYSRDPWYHKDMAERLLAEGLIVKNTRLGEYEISAAGWRWLEECIPSWVKMYRETMQ